MGIGYCTTIESVDMNYSKPDLVEICKVQFEPVAHIIKSHLESEGIPAYLRMETYGRLYGLYAGGLEQVSILVLREHVEEAKHIIASQDIEQEQYKNDGGDKNPTKFSKLASLLWGIVLFFGGH